VARAVFYDFEPGLIDALRALPVGELIRPDNPMNRETTGARPTAQGLGTNSSESPCILAGFAVNSNPTPGHAPRFECAWGLSLLAVFILPE
jgi:hypothetical protein